MISNGDYVPGVEDLQFYDTQIYRSMKVINQKKFSQDELELLNIEFMDDEGETTKGIDNNDNGNVEQEK